MSPDTYYPLSAVRLLSPELSLSFLGFVHAGINWHMSKPEVFQGTLLIFSPRQREPQLLSLLLSSRQYVCQKPEVPDLLKISLRTLNLCLGIG